MPSHHAHVKQLFGFPDSFEAPTAIPAVDRSMLPAAGEIVLIGGASGAGKSLLLRTLRKAFARAVRWIDVPRIAVPDRRVIDVFADLPVHDAMQRLARVGLAEAGLLVESTKRLSDGQRFRLRLAIALLYGERARKPTVLVCDEFAALLDDVTAAVIATSIRRVVSALPRCGAIVAIGREIIATTLEPDRIASCDFGAIEWSRPGGTAVATLTGTAA